MRRIGSVRRYDYEKTGTSTDIIERHFLNGRNQGKSSAQKI
jgi:hypothetical protein